MASGGWFGIYLAREHVLAGEVWSVTISPPGCDARRRLFTDRASAYAFALEQGQVCELPVFDHCDAEPET